MNAALQNYFNSLCCGGGCTCPPGYTKNPKTGICEKNEVMPANVTNSGYCLAATSHFRYAEEGTRLFAYPFDVSAVGLPFGAGSSAIIADMTTRTQWRNNDEPAILGPFNRAAVWVDSNCDGAPDPLMGGAKTTIGHTFLNSGPDKVYYIGVSGDNFFTLIVNAVTIASEIEDFRKWFLIPVLLKSGANYINVTVRGDGSYVDSVGLVLYDNTAEQLQAATSDSQLNILFTSASLRGSSYDVATCPDGWSLDNSGGTGNYVCRRTLTANCS